MDSTTDPPELGPALLRWLQTFDFATKAKTWDDLKDGFVLWRVLQDIAPEYFHGSLPEDEAACAGDNWIPRWQNLKHINRNVLSFINDECGKLQELTRRMNPDLKAMAIDAAPAASQEVTKFVLLAALYYPDSNQRMIGVLDQLSTKASMVIATCIGQMEALDRKLADTHTDTESEIDRISSPGPDLRAQQAFQRDRELMHEERLITAHTRIKQLEEQSSALMLDLEAAHKEVGELETNVRELNYRLEHGDGKVEGEVVEQLRYRAQQDKENLAQLEAELQDARSAVETQEKQLDKLQRESEAYQRLQEEFQALKVERDELRQISKANENLKKKIQALQDSDKSTEQLRQDFAAAQQELQALRPMKQRMANLQKANEENAKTIQNGEQEIFDQKTTRKRLEHEMRMLSRQIDSFKDRHRQDQDLIREQSEKMRELDAAPTSADKDTLDEEITSKDKAFNDLKSRNSELEVEIARLRESASAIDEVSPENDTSASASAYALLQTRCDKLEKQYLEVFAENLGLSSAIAEKSAEEITNSQPFLDIRARLAAETDQRQTAEKRTFDTESALAEVKAQLVSVESKLSVVGKDEAAALADLQHAATSENQILHEENTRLLGHIRTYESDLEEHRSLLRHVLLDKDNLLKQPGDARFQEEVKLATEQLRAVVDDKSRVDDMALRLAQRIEDAREQAIAATAQAEEDKQASAVKMKELQDALQAASETASKAPESSRQPVAASAEQANVQRELRLMTSAWYDLSRRMQSDAVVVQRRLDNPKGLLSRQRKVVEGAFWKRQ